MEELWQWYSGIENAAGLTYWPLEDLIEILEKYFSS